VTKKQLFRLRGHQMSVKCVRQMPENEFLFASGSRDGDVFLWDIRFPVIKPVGSLVGIHDSPAMSMDHSRRKKRRVTASTTQRSVTCLDFTADSREIATGGATDG
jgi:denticleless